MWGKKHFLIYVKTFQWKWVENLFTRFLLKGEYFKLYKFAQDFFSVLKYNVLIWSTHLQIKTLSRQDCWLGVVKAGVMHNFWSGVRLDCRLMIWNFLMEWYLDLKFFLERSLIQDSNIENDQNFYVKDIFDIFIHLLKNLHGLL